MGLLRLSVGVTPLGALPMTFPRDAYNFVYNEYYRDETLQPEVLLDQEAILNRAWEKDYFTSSLPWQQRGTSPALPITGTSSAVWDNVTINGLVGITPISVVNANATTPELRLGNANAAINTLNALNSNTIDLSTASAFDIADLRIAFQIQKWMERNARSGARYTEFLKAHFGVSPRDERLQRPEYIGGSKSPVIISEVLQTSQTDTTPQGTLAGHGVSISDAYCGKYHAKNTVLLSESCPLCHAPLISKELIDNG